MRAVTLHGGNFETTDLPDPVPGEGQLLVAPLATGICGSDLHLREQMTALHAATPEAQRAALPKIIPGHEFSAKIIEVGPGTDTQLKVGMRITANPFVHGAAGPECVGLSPVYSGGFATLSVVDAMQAVEIPATVPDELAALTEPLAVGLHAANLANRQAGPNVVIGCGPVGLAVILALRVAGRGPILAADFSASRRAAAEAIGADIVIDPAETSAYEHWSDLEFTPATISPLLEETLARPAAPNIFECVGAPGLIDQVMTSAPQHSHIIVVGVCAHEDKFTPVVGIQKELSLEFSFAYSLAEFRQSLENITQHQELIERLITSKIRLEETESGFNALANDPEEIKVLVLPQLR